ncbi:MAG: TolC family protein [Prevotella sp.]|nr:TolC family protein [Prevotella sp.]
MRRIILGLSMLPMIALAQTLEECQQAAERNYPLIRQYGLIEKTTDLTVANIQKGWLPQISASAQATLQSDVMSWPEQMQSMLTAMGLDLKGLKKDQYRVGIDVQQMVFDGGAIKSQKEIAKRQGDVQSAQTEVMLYSVRKRVNEMYFGLLLLDEQLKLNADLQASLASNEKKLASMLKGGTASESDFNSVKAERLNVVQQATSLQAQRQALARMLSVFCGIEAKAPSKPPREEAFGAAVLPLEGDRGELRPELRAIDAQLRLADVQEKALDAALKPKLGVFAQGYYGYPGYNVFEDMMRRRFSWNGMIGARLSWNIGALYTRKNDKAKLDVQRSALHVQREVFLFNNHLEQIQQNENIERYQKLMADDEEIIALRSSIRKAAESKLAHGIIDVNGLVKEINAENSARVQRSVHEIEMLKEIYDLKYTLGEK